MFPSVPLHTVGLVDAARLSTGAEGSDKAVKPEAMPEHPLTVVMEKPVYVPAASPLRINALPDTFTTAESAATPLLNFKV